MAKSSSMHGVTPEEVSREPTPDEAASWLRRWKHLWRRSRQRSGRCWNSVSRSTAPRRSPRKSIARRERSDGSSNVCRRGWKSGWGETAFSGGVSSCAVPHSKRIPMPSHGRCGFSPRPGSLIPQSALVRAQDPKCVQTTDAGDEWRSVDHPGTFARELPIRRAGSRSTA